MNAVTLDREYVLDRFVAAAREAAAVVMKIYESGDVGAELKGPNDPVTRADKAANALLLERLGEAFPGVPIVAEESDPSTYDGYGASPLALFVDPVDGTREFIERNGEFCVMIGLAEEGRATCGVILCPALASGPRLYAGAEDVGAYLLSDANQRTTIKVSPLARLEHTRVAVSRFHRSKSVDARLAALGAKELVEIGSSGVKGVYVAGGDLDVYAHPSQGPMKLWDACAPDALIRAAGGVYTDSTGRPFDYRAAIQQGKGTLGCNPVLHAEAVARFSRVPTPTS